MKIALNISYSGANYHGWQRQQKVVSIQAKLEEALSRVAASPIQLYCAGRTDAGVHATRQVVHFETDSPREIDAWVLGTNSNLPDDIVVNWAAEVNEEFHARFSATARRYWYIIHNDKSRPAILAKHITWHYHTLNVPLMQEAASHLLGKQDFSSFRAAQCQSKTATRTVHYVSVKRFGERVILDICANAFLHHMVRNIVGSLLRVGEGRQPSEWIEEILQAKNRQLAAPTAPADGLYLVGVDYPEEFKLPGQHGIGPWFCHAAL